MAAPAKQTSRWGSLLQQAVAGVESRLDNILADGDGEEGVGDEGLQAKKPPVATLAPIAAKAESSSSRTSSTNRTNDRLQERLARAMAAKNIAQKGEKADSLALSSGVPSRTGSPVTVNESPRRSLDIASTEGGEKEPTEGQPEQTPSTTAAEQGNIVAAEPRRLETMMMAPPAVNGNVAKTEAELGLRHTPRPSTDSTRSSLPRTSTDS
ncbi:hypothetical protein BGZ57DRAFT_737597, partial [Hyaloscypha finlandica]